MKLEKRIAAVVLTLCVAVGAVVFLNYSGIIGKATYAESYPKAHSTEYYVPSGTTFIRYMGVGRSNGGLFGSSDGAKKALTDNGYTLLDKDLNDNSGGDFVYAGYKTTTDPNLALNDIKVLNNGGSPDTYTYNSKTYYVVGKSPASDPSHLAHGVIDLNKGCGSDTNDLFFYAATSCSAGAPISGIYINTSTGNNTGYETVKFMYTEDGNNADLNRGAGGDDIFCHIQHYPDSNKVDTAALRTELGKAAALMNSGKTNTTLVNAYNSAKAIIDDYDGDNGELGWSSTYLQGSIDYALTTLKSAELTVQKAIILYAPEMIYLKPGDKKSFEYYLDRGNSEDSSLRTGKQTSGNFYFYSSEATSVTSVTCSSTVSDHTVTVSGLATSSTNGTIKSSITSGSLSTALSEGSYETIKWTVTYVVHNDTFNFDETRTATTYTVLYSPFQKALATSSSDTAENDYKPLFHSREYRYRTASFLTAIFGVHKVDKNHKGGTIYIGSSGYGDNGFDCTGTYKKTLASYSDAAPFFAGFGKEPSSSDLLSQKDSSPGNAAGTNGFCSWYGSTDGDEDAYVNGATGTIYINTDRVKKIGDIPNFHAYSYCTGLYQNDSGWWQTFNYSAKYCIGDTSKLTTSNNGYSSTQYSSASNIDGVGGESTSLLSGTTQKYDPGTGLDNSSISGGKTLINFIYYQVQTRINGSNSRLQNGTANTFVSFVANNKNSLRNAFTGGVNQGKQQAYYKTTSWSNFSSALQTAGTKLGKITETDESETVSSTLNNLSLKTGTVSYTLNSGSWSGTAPATSGSCTDVVSIPVPVRSHYTFTGWTVSGTQNGKFKSNSDKSALYMFWTTDGASDTLVANWEINKHNYVVDLNGGSINGSTADISAVKEYGESITVTAPTRTGYTFAGWSATGITASGNSFNFTMPDNDVTLTANWTPITYTVAYNGNSNTGGSTASSSHTYDVAKNLTANGFSRAFTVTYNGNSGTAGKSSDTATATFSGWATSTGGSVAYTNSQSVTNLSSTNGATVNLYAKWTDASVTLPNATRTGYTFAGWYDAASGGNLIGAKDASYKPTANKTLYAHWTANTNTAYKVEHYQMNVNGSGYTKKDTENKTGTTDTTVSATSKTYTGFTYDSTVTGTVASGNVAGDGSLVLKLYYKRNQHKVTVDKNSHGTVSGASNAVYYGATVTLGATPSTGYKFSSWTLTNLSDSSSTTNAYSFTMPDKDVTAKANWTAYKYKLTINPDNGGTTSVVTQDYGSTYEVTNPTKNGYTFQGWELTQGNTTPAS